MSGYGVGIGWRPEIAGYVAQLPGLRFAEAVAESLPRQGEAPRALTALRERGVALVPHGLRLNLGGADPVDPDQVAHLAHCAALLGSPLVSEHIAFVRAGGTDAGHLLPLPRSWDAVHAIVDNTRRAMAELPVPLALEPIAALLDWPDDELTEAQFLTEILDRTDAGLLLDVANIYANARNRDEDPLALLDALPLERVAYVHVAGGSVREDGLYHDTHTDPTPPEVLDLVTALCERCEPPALMLERDGHYPAADALTHELDAIAGAAGLPRITAGAARIAAR